MKEKILEMAGKIRERFQDNPHVEAVHTDYGHEKEGLWAKVRRFLRSEPEKFHAETFIHLRVPGTLNQEHVRELDREVSLAAAGLGEGEKHKLKKISVTAAQLVKERRITGFKITMKN